MISRFLFPCRHMMIPWVGIWIVNGWLSITGCLDGLVEWMNLRESWDMDFVNNDNRGFCVLIVFL